MEEQMSARMKRSEEVHLVADRTSDKIAGLDESGWGLVAEADYEVLIRTKPLKLTKEFNIHLAQHSDRTKSEPVSLISIRSINSRIRPFQARTFQEDH